MSRRNLEEEDEWEDLDEEKDAETIVSCPTVIKYLKRNKR